MLKSEIWGNNDGFLFLKIYFWFVLIGKTKLNMKSTYRGSIYGYDLSVLDSKIFIPYNALRHFLYVLLNAEKKEMRFLSVKITKREDGSYVEIINK